jgi:uncharacterized protein YbaP (TraB family)
MAMLGVLLTALLAWAAQSLAAQGLVYRVTQHGDTPSYLVGTMHSEDPRVTALLEDFEPLIRQVDVVAIEMVPDAVALFAVGAATLLPADQRLRDLVGRERFQALRAAAAQRGIPGEVLDRLKPWAAAVTLGLPTPETGRFLDLEIYLSALAQERRVVGLESAAEQLAVFDEMALELQLAMLDDSVKNAGQVPKQLEALTAAYLDGDLALLDRLAREQYRDMPPEVAHWFDRVLLDQRNARMLDRLEPLLEDGRVFVAVGAMHLSGESGLVEGLKARGYRVERQAP